MLRFQIPKSHLSGFRSLISLSGEEIKIISSYLSQQKPGVGARTLVEDLAKLLGKPENKIARIGVTLFGLGGLLQSQNKGIDIEELSDGLANSFRDQVEIKVEEQQVAILKDYLLKLLNSMTTLRITFKAYELLSENERIYREGHIVTDIRLLFKDDIENKERHALVLHRLKVESEEDGEAVSYYYSLNKSDLENLRDQVNRALEKEALIKNDYKEISFIEIKD